MSYTDLVIGCGKVGLPLLWELTRSPGHEAHGLEATSRVGGSSFLISRLQKRKDILTAAFDEKRTLPNLEIWWEREWKLCSDVDWSSEEWAYVLPQWKYFFEELVEVFPNENALAATKGFVE